MKSEREQRVKVTFVMEQHLGHETYYRNLRRVLEHDDTLSPTWIEVDYSPDTTASSRIPFLPTKARGPLAGFEQVAKGVRGTDSDVLFFNTQVPAVLARPWLRSTPYVVATDITPRQYDRMADLYQHQPDGNGLVAQLKHRVNVRTFQEAKRVVCWSSWCAASVATEYDTPEDRIDVIAPGVQLDVWKPKPLSEVRPRSRILFVGGDFHRKGGPSVVKAFNELPAGSSELHLVTRSDVAFDRSDIVVHRNLTPNSAELMSLYTSADVFVLPSRAEAFGIAATEALACGLPVIATRTGGLADIVEHDVTGYLISPDDANDFGHYLRILTTDPESRNKMATAARRRAEQMFDADRNGRRISELLNSIGRETNSADVRDD